MATFHVYKAVNSEYRWRLRATNGRIVADSGEGYRSKTDCLAGIEIVKREGPAAPVKDETEATHGSGYSAASRF